MLSVTASLMLARGKVGCCIFALCAVIVCQKRVDVWQVSHLADEAGQAVEISETSDFLK